MKEPYGAAAYRGESGEGQIRDRPRLILVVEDDDALRNLLKIALDCQGYAVVTAATEKEAESTLQQWGHAGLELVVSDINLTQGNLNQEGYALYQRWSRQYPTLPYMLMSADPTNRRLPAIQDGRVRFVEKPFRINSLLNSVRELLGQARSDDASNFRPGVATHDADIHHH